jgi:hypothetical protein
MPAIFNIYSNFAAAKARWDPGFEKDGMSKTEAMQAMHMNVDAGKAMGQKFHFSVKRDAIYLSDGAAAELTGATCVMNAVQHGRLL